MTHFYHHFHPFQVLVPFFDTWGYTIIILSSFLEAFPLLGYISPGGTSVILGGFLAKTHILNIKYVLLFSVLGAFVGDFVVYIIGKFYGRHFLTKYGRYFFLKETHIEKTQRLLQEHAGKAFIIGRFNFLTRSLSPFLAGVSDIKIFKFSIFTAISVFFWATVHILIGFIAGSGFEVASRYVNYILLIAVVLIIVIFYGYRFVNKRRHIFQKYHLYTLAFNILSIYIFAKALEDVVNGEWLHNLDLIINNLIPRIWNPVLIQIMIVISNILTPINVFILACLFIGYLIHRREWYYGLLSFLAITSGTISLYLFKLLTSINRPALPLIPTINSSFPSGHATLIAIFGILVFHCLRKDMKNQFQRILLFCGSALIILLVGFSRIYLNAHWLSDVIAGFALGIFWVTFYILFLRGGNFFWKQIEKIGRAFLMLK